MTINLDLYNRIKEITMSDYDLITVNKEKEICMIDNSEIISMLEDLICEVDTLKEKMEEIIQDTQDNYQKISYEQQIGYNKEW